MSAHGQVVKVSNHRSTILKPAPELQQTSCGIKALNISKLERAGLKYFGDFAIISNSASLHGRQQCVNMYLVQPVYKCPAQLVPVQAVQDNSVLMSHLASPPIHYKKEVKEAS